MGHRRQSLLVVFDEESEGDEFLAALHTVAPPNLREATAAALQAQWLRAELSNFDYLVTHGPRLPTTPRSRPSRCVVTPWRCVVRWR